jgi:hypothetical protein
VISVQIYADLIRCVKNGRIPIDHDLIEAELEIYIISGLEHIYLAETMELCWSGFKEGQYFEFLQLFTEPLSGILSEERIRFKAH